jgi:superfamily II DNA or RNA helicase
MLQVREHQLEVVVKLEDGFNAGHRCQLLYAPTGFGKTVVILKLFEILTRAYSESVLRFVAEYLPRRSISISKAKRSP